MEIIKVRTQQRSQMVDITQDVADLVRKSGVAVGHCLVYVPHTTAGVTINEHADPDVATDIVSVLEKLVPWNGPYTHRGKFGSAFESFADGFLGDSRRREQFAPTRHLAGHLLLRVRWPENAKCLGFHHRGGLSLRRNTVA